MTNVATALERIAGDLERLANQIDEGDLISADDLILASRRLKLQAENIRKGIVE